MPLYSVELTAVANVVQHQQVRADSRDEAVELAEQNCCDHTWHYNGLSEEPDIDGSAHELKEQN